MTHGQGPGVRHGCGPEGGGRQVRVQGRDLLLLRPRLQEGVRRESGEVLGGGLMLKIIALARSGRLPTNRYGRWLLAAVLTVALAAAVPTAAGGGGSSERP